MYEIIIKQTLTKTKIVKGEWKVVAEKEVPREDRFYSGSQGTEPKTRIENVYGYPPPREQEVTEELEIFKQSVSDLDLASVIKAINKI